MSPTARRLALAALVLLLPGRAEAHLVSTGFGPYYDGISHLLVTAPDLLAALALALLAGLRGPRIGRTVVFAATAAWGFGGLLGLTASVQPPWAVATTASFLLLGALLALDRALPLPLLTVLATLVGLGHGFLSGTEAAATGIGFVGLLGSTTALFVILVLASALAVTLSQGWTRIALRVAGSWIAAIGMLMLGWLFRPGT